MESGFAACLAQSAEQPESRTNTIGDGQENCTYCDLETLLDGLEGQLQKQGVEPHFCVAVECNNSLSSALLALCLLRGQRSFLLTPPSAVNGELKPTPLFCSHRVSAQSLTSLHVEPNPDYNGSPSEPGKMYLRTSGSMGASKIVVHSQERLLGNARNCIAKYGFRPSSRAMVPVPIAHMYGFGAEFLPAILAGASIELQDKTNILKYLNREKVFEPTIAFVTPAVCDMLLKGYKSPRSCYEVMVTSGQRIKEEQFRALDLTIGGRLVNQYGSTEMGATAACNPGDSIDRKTWAIGEPMRGVELQVDRANGELYCRHPFGFEGYMDDQGTWLKRVGAGDWYRTGDLVAERNGSITVVGRADASVNRSGYLVLLSDIERTLETQDAVSEIAVVAGKMEGKQGPRIAAFCVARSGMPLDAAKLRQRCFELLPHYAIPDEVRVIDQMPSLASGKVDRQSLAALID